ncbi:MAG: type II toxin-antitoxin system Phd/YefM family antitoxin [Candidatus Omnitrophica bacterium]|nr:type II toxin-antitoxin system Phd/YefM family antitoxin [Candidatus Omnitrophota bacterium]
MVMSITQFRKNIYSLLDKVATSGESFCFEYQGKLLQVVRVETIGKLARLKKRACLIGDPHEIVELDWSGTVNIDR